MNSYVVSEIEAGGYRLPVYATTRASDIDADTVRRVPVIVAGAGLAGLAFAVDLASRGFRCLVLDEDDTVGVRGASSRGIAYARKTLEILQRVGAVAPVRAKGVTWSVGRTLDLDDELFRFDLAEGSRSTQPPFVNVQQFYVEAALVDRAYELGVEIRWKNTVRELRLASDHVQLGVTTPEGDYVIKADWLVDATGVNSPLRSQAGIGVDVERGVDRWCICDARFETPWPLERWTWVRARFNGERAVWQHPLPDDVWRLDYQLPENDDGGVDDARARAMVTAHVGTGVKFDIVWAGPWTYRNQLAHRFHQGRVFLVGDAAHAFSPFGGRGGNSGVQDAENLAWKLALVIARQAPPALLGTYDTERRAAAMLNIAITAKTVRFLRPSNWYRRLVRSVVLVLARSSPRMRRFVNTGKLSSPFEYLLGDGLSHGGHALPDLRLISGEGKAVLLSELVAGPIAGIVLDFCDDPARSSELREALGAAVPALRYRRVASSPKGEDLLDDEGLRVECRMPSSGEAAVLVRPDAHVCALAVGARRSEIITAVRAMLRVGQPLRAKPTPLRRPSARRV